MNNPIDFNSIRGDLPGGQRAAFEELICQLARRHAPVPTSFRRIEGAGGDGGVECIHCSPEGGIVGYQAKYYTSPGGIDWGAIDKSVHTALSIYPDLTVYVIAVACTFTGRRRTKGGGISNGTWGEWDERVEKWQNEFTQSGRSVEFVVWTEFEIFDLLTIPASAGLRAYWFHATEFSAEWFTQQTNLACAALDERYNPNDHVDVRLQTLFEFIAHYPKSYQILQEHFRAISKRPFPEHELRTNAPQFVEELIIESAAAFQQLLACESEIKVPIWNTWDTDKWQHTTHTAATKVSQLTKWVWNTLHTFRIPEDEMSRRTFDSLFDDLNKISEELERLETLLTQPYFAAERTRTALIEGRSGTGKSHLLAHIAEVALSENQPVVLLLGQQLRDQPLWPQILQRLGLENRSADDFLGALDAAAESAKVRALILIDAINEGAGASLWRNELAPFLEQIRQYPNLVCVISCRSEYVDYIIPPLVLQSVPRFQIRGFETIEEKTHAARIYLDKRGISRPATPWLAPEFINPLFLRSCCNALQREGKTEFPRGLTGAKAIFAFFINSVARHLGVGRDGSNDLVSPTKSTLYKIAIEIAKNRRDYIDRQQAEEIAQIYFQRFQCPATLTWLEVLQRNGLIRFDPDPVVDPQDPLHEPADVVRFSFQRFQDHLMAEALLAEVADIKAAFDDGGYLAFIRKDKHTHGEWQGLIEALSIQLPERFQIELVDALPGAAAAWWRLYQIRDAFTQSIRWRSHDAFTQRTLELFNPPFNLDQSQWAILIELSTSVDHPWNADFMHRNLLDKKLPERDAFWTMQINNATNDESHPIYILIDWSLQVQNTASIVENQRLGAVVLTWCFTATSRPIRDRSTKALTTVLLTQPSIFAHLLSAFATVDDLYVWERLFAAAYGACCIDPRPERLRIYAELAFNHIFISDVPPENISLRDYARGIIELADHAGVLPKSVDRARCHPPYKSSLPELDITEIELNHIADQAGDDAILDSCCGDFGDFGHYAIEPAASVFIETPLSISPPYRSEEKFDQFQTEVINNDEERKAALTRLQIARVERIRHLVVVQPEDESTEEVSFIEDDAIKWAIEFQVAEAALLALFSSDERNRYLSEVAPWLRMESTGKDPEPHQIDIKAARCWVAKRAYDWGWTRKQFPGEVRQYLDPSRSRPRVERIGKKYQWLALSELLCKLADNYWIGGVHAWSTKRYDTPLDIGFWRDIDPTVHSALDRDENQQVKPDIWVLGPEISTPESTEDELAQWPFSADPGKTLTELISTTDPQQNKWITLFNHRRVLTHYADHTSMQHHYPRQEEFRLLYCVLVRQANTMQMIEHLKNEKRLDVGHWQPPEIVDGPYLLEAPWRTTWPQQQWDSTRWITNKGIPVALPVQEYVWESHLDASLPEGVRTLVPSPWLINHLQLMPDRKDISIYRDAANKCRFIGSNLAPAASAALIDAALFNAYLNKHSLQCIWLLVAERSSWLGRRGDSVARRRTEGICWVEDGKPTVLTWNKDRADEII